ncbi:MAG TPA: carboxyl transferase domain-containing protein [Amycolatopsis sp.]|nr:carboxyl transferase domain-containing protein [Amycolatopsis sp.]
MTVAAQADGVVLIANRGEVAARIADTARKMGLRTIAVHTAAEAGEPYVLAADEARELRGHGPAAYLDDADLVRIAAETGATLVHPGYGFLSESAKFASACLAAGLVFVGPEPETLALLGDKPAARELAVRIEIPVLPATADVEDTAFLSAPAMVKAAAGGGGRGMRVVTEPARLADAVRRCRAEALRGFGDDTVYLERYLPRCRHIEVQLAGDGSDVLVLGTRDCSLQHRHQKVVELAPATGLHPVVARALPEDAARLGREVRLRGLATCEFLVDLDDPGAYYFIEANPRLQVEHGITEQVTGLDLVALQLTVAAGGPLPAGVTEQGHAAEARVTVSSVAPITALELPEGPGVRVDTAAAVGTTAGGDFDPLLAKVMAHASTPDGALRSLVAAVRGLRIAGPATNRDELVALLDDLTGNAAAVTTTLLDERATPTPASASPGLVPLRSHVGGTVVEVCHAPGDPVAAGATLVVVEAMKMEHEICAPSAGTVQHIEVAVGDQVTAGRQVAAVEPTGTPAIDDVPESRPLPSDPGRIRPDLAEVRRRHAAGLDEARPQAATKRHRRGKRTARENVADLADPGGELVEHGALVIAAQRRRRPVEELERETPADGLVTGFVPVHGAAVGVLAYDYTVLAGTQGVQNHKKAERMFELARRHRTPVVIFAEGGGGRPGDTDNLAKATGMDLGTFVALGRLNGRAPTVAIAAGRCFAGNAALVGACDLTVATADANIGMGGPAMIEGGGLGTVAADDIGPAHEQAVNGAVDVVVPDEAAAVRVARSYLSLFGPAPRSWEAGDQHELRDLVPERRSRTFEVRRVVEVVADAGTTVELRAAFAPGIITALARVAGRTVGFVANDSTHLGGAIDSDGADKMARFLGLCDNYGIPVVTLCDTPGFMVGPDSERTAAVRHFGRLFTVGPNLSVPLCTVVLRRSYGLGGQAMAGGSFRVPDAIVAWPTGHFGAMGPEGAVRLGFRRELDQIADPAAREREFRRLVGEYEQEGSALNAASVFEIDDVIDPVDTRRWITSVLDRATAGKPRRHRVDPW